MQKQAIDIKGIFRKSSWFLSCIFLLTFSSISYAQHPTLDKFKSVDASLSNSAKSIGIHTQQYLDSIRKNGNENPEMVMEAEQLFKEQIALFEFMDSLVRSLREYAADDIVAAETMLVNTEKGNELYNRLKQIIRNSRAGSRMSSMTKENIESNVSGMHLEKTPADWQREWFRSVPLIAATTIIQKFKLDVAMAVQLSLESTWQFLK